jgi:hypothetical protein
MDPGQGLHHVFNLHAGAEGGRPDRIGQVVEIAPSLGSTEGGLRAMRLSFRLAPWILCAAAVSPGGLLDRLVAPMAAATLSS